jgi:hypothetical protein
MGLSRKAFLKYRKINNIFLVITLHALWYDLYHDAIGAE